MSKVRNAETKKNKKTEIKNKRDRQTEKGEGGGDRMREGGFVYIHRRDESFKKLIWVKRKKSSKKWKKNE